MFKKTNFKIFCLGILILVFGIMVIGCEKNNDDDWDGTVPTWAQGYWFDSPSGTGRRCVAAINQFTISQSYSYSSFDAYVVGVSGNTITFGANYRVTVTKSSSTSIKISSSPIYNGTAYR